MKEMCEINTFNQHLLKYKQEKWEEDEDEEEEEQEYEHEQEIQDQEQEFDPIIMRKMVESSCGCASFFLDS